VNFLSTTNGTVGRLLRDGVELFVNDKRHSGEAAERGTVLLLLQGDPAVNGFWPTVRSRPMP